jgi:type I restriction enzyme R subunit
MALTNERNLEELIENSLIKNGYIQGVPQEFDRTYAIDKGMFLKFLEKTQKDKLDTFKKSNGSGWEKILFDRINSEIETRGMIDVLRHGIEHYSLNSSIDIAYFKPNSNLNKSAWDRYDKNIIAVTRQLKYSLKNENSIDMVILLNGFPLVAIELKNEFTGQNVWNAVKQFKEDRDPRELIFNFNKRILVYFAVDTNEIMMTTELKGKSTFFLPFNKGNEGGKGNPFVPEKMKTHYLWEEILLKDSLLDIFKRFYFIQTEEKKDKNGKVKKKQKAIFPRFHQLDVVRKIEKDVLATGTGQKYLIQHSAGSGKTNSISWLAHRLANLHNEKDENIFDSIIVITDRKILDKQLQDAIYQLEHKKGVVEKIDENKRSSHLAEAIKTKTKIIITTIQKFPFALQKIDELSKGRYAVIIDEAHSSTAGENMSALKETLAGKTLDEAVAIEKDEETTDDKINSILEKRTDTEKISFFAFTATPKNKTLQIFGRTGEDNLPHEFHLYSMRQAIEEGFILDVLQNYATYEVYYKVGKKIEDNPEFDKGKGKKAVTRFVSLNEYNIKQKVEVMVEDFINNRSIWLNGKSKGMIVTASRLHAVRYKLALDEYVKEKGYKIKSLVAFSGAVKDEDTEYTEEGMNGIKQGELPAFFDKEDDYRILIVADKYQTGFDQPKLCAMYVDKKLTGIKAVQTLSRLNRTYSGKDSTFILDFFNKTSEIIEAFSPYFERTNIEETTDPNLVFDIFYQLEQIHVYLKEEKEKFAKLYLKEKKTNKDHELMNNIIDKGIERFKLLDEKQQEEFKVLAVKYTRVYNFLIQIYPLKNLNLYKLQIYLTGFVKKLPKDDRSGKINLDNLLSLDYYRLQQIAGEGKDGEDISLNSMIVEESLPGFTGAGASRKREEELETLDNIIDRINKIFGMDLNEGDRLVFGQIIEDFKDMANLKDRAKVNTYDEFRESFAKKEFLRGVIKRKAINQNIFNKIIQDNSFKNFIIEEIARELYNEFTIQY